MDTALLLGIFAVVGAVFGWVFYLISQMRTQQSKEVEVLKGQINALESQAPLKVTEDLERRIQITESELERLREDNRRLAEAAKVLIKKSDMIDQLVRYYDKVDRIYAETHVSVHFCPHCRSEGSLITDEELGFDKIEYECGLLLKYDGQELSVVSPCPNAEN